MLPTNLHHYFKMLPSTPYKKLDAIKNGFQKTNQANGG